MKNMLSVAGFSIIPYPHPKGNFAEPFNIKVPEDFIEREINFDKNGECRDNDTLHLLWLFIHQNNLLDMDVKNSNGVEIIVSPINFNITYIKKE